MKYITIIILVFLISLQSCTDNSKSNIIELFNPSPALFDVAGIIEISYYPNGSREQITGIKTEGFFFVKYYENGSIKEVRQFLIGNRNTYYCELYSEDSVLLSSYNIRDGLLDGPEYKYFLNQNIFEENNYNKGIRNGISKQFYNNGEIHAIIEYWNNEIIYFASFDNNGKKDKEKYLASYEFYLSQQQYSNLLNIHIVFGGLEFAENERYLNYYLENQSNSDTILIKERNLLVQSKDTVITIPVDSNTDYFFGFVYYYQEFVFEYFGCGEFIIKNDSLNLKEMCGDGDFDFTTKIGKPEVDAMKELYKVNGWEFKL
jgi:antitoxin component YwqK of YwqJK toxin-antitoxin module